MAGWSLNRPGEGHLDADAPSAQHAVSVRFRHDARGATELIKVPLAPTLSGSSRGGHRALRESSSGGLTDPNAGAHP